MVDEENGVDEGGYNTSHQEQSTHEVVNDAVNVHISSFYPDYHIGSELEILYQ